MKAELRTLPEILRKLPADPIISVAGAGGKTTLIFRIVHQLRRTAIITTTTKVGGDQILAADRQMICADFYEQIPSGVIWVSPSLKMHNGKIIGCTQEDFTKLAAVCKRFHFPLVNEADGAARRHIKAPASHEPSIPPETNVYFYLAGLDVLSKPVSEEFVHRPELFCKLTGAEMNEPITAEHILRLLDHPEGGLKNINASALRAVYLTHADTEERISAGRYIAGKIKNYHYICLS